jgi:hypothetical protein
MPFKHPPSNNNQNIPPPTALIFPLPPILHTPQKPWLPTPPQPQPQVLLERQELLVPLVLRLLLLQPHRQKT